MAVITHSGVIDAVFDTSTGSHAVELGSNSANVITWHDGPVGHGPERGRSSGTTVSEWERSDVTWHQQAST
uniref:Uncharacterized protein n=1 Tax=Rathayibacter iranicus TaxID=59737 RepID=A0A5J6SG31_9MICO|nr:hypothetical protein [Rathayibacter iranicus]